MVSTLGQNELGYSSKIAEQLIVMGSQDEAKLGSMMPKYP